MGFDTELSTSPPTNYSLLHTVTTSFHCYFANTFTYPPQRNIAANPLAVPPPLRPRLILSHLPYITPLTGIRGAEAEPRFVFYADTHKSNDCVLVGVLGDEGRDPGLSDDAVVESDEVGVVVDDGGGDADEMSARQLVQPVRDEDVTHAHLAGARCTFREKMEHRQAGGRVYCRM